MTTMAPLVADTVWQARAAALAATVVADGELADPEWAEVFAAVPRHVFVPRFFRRDTTGDLVAIEGSDPARRDEWLDAVYSETALTTQLGQIDPGNTLRPLTVPRRSTRWWPRHASSSHRRRRRHRVGAFPGLSRPVHGTTSSA